MSKHLFGKWREIGKYTKEIEEFYGENAGIIVKTRPVTIQRAGSRHHSFADLLNKQFKVPKTTVRRHDVGRQNYYGLSDRDIERNIERMHSKKVVDPV